jgi:hypothetical protein
MLKGAKAQVGDKVEFDIEQGTARQLAPPPMNPVFKKKLIGGGLWDVYGGLTPSRRKEILKYMSFLKTESSIKRNIDRVLAQLREMDSVKNR